VHLHGAREALDELGPRAIELRGALLHQALKLVALVGEREVHAHASLQHLGVDRLGDVVDRAGFETFDLRLGLGFPRQENDRDIRRPCFALQRAAHLEARDTRHLDVEQDQIGPRLAFGGHHRGAAVFGGDHLVIGAQRFRHQREQIAGVVDCKNHRAFFGAHSGAL